MKIEFDYLRKIIEEIYPEVVAWRRHIHQNPELGDDERETSDFVVDRLSEMSIPIEKNLSGFGLKGYITGKNNGLGVGIRADMDALPIDEATGVEFKSKKNGVMHACGHDIHTAMLLGTAKAVKYITSDIGELAGNVAFFFEPAEETRGGAKGMIEEGCLRNPTISHTLGLHISPEIKSGKLEFVEGYMCAASTMFQVKVKGKSCHGAHPYRGVDPLIPACEMVTAIQSIITRNIAPTEAALITIGSFHSGTAGNAIPDESCFKGIIRVLDMKNRILLKERFYELCNGIAAANGAACEVEFEDSYPALRNDDELYRMSLEVCTRHFGDENIIVEKKASMGTDDFAYFCEASKGLYLSIGTCKEGEEIFPLHSSRLNPDEEAMKNGMLAELLIILRVLGVEIV